MASRKDTIWLHHKRNFEFSRRCGLRSAGPRFKNELAHVDHHKDASFVSVSAEADCGLREGDRRVRSAELWGASFPADQFLTRRRKAMRQLGVVPNVIAPAGLGAGFDCDGQGTGHFVNSTNHSPPRTPPTWCGHQASGFGHGRRRPRQVSWHADDSFGGHIGRIAAVTVEGGSPYFDMSASVDPRFCDAVKMTKTGNLFLFA